MHLYLGLFGERPDGGGQGKRNGEKNDKKVRSDVCLQYSSRKRVHVDASNKHPRKTKLDPNFFLCLCSERGAEHRVKKVASILRILRILRILLLSTWCLDSTVNANVLGTPSCLGTMPTFESKPLRKSNTLLARIAPQVRRRPLLLFGLPFLATIVGASFGLANLTQTRYDYNATKVQTISKEEELRMKKDRKRIDIREEYFVSVLACTLGLGSACFDVLLTIHFERQKLQSKEDELDNWEPKRIERPQGVEEWGVAPTKYRSIQTEGLSSQDAELERSRGFTAENVRSSSRQQPAVVLGADGKPCRACNSKLAFAAAMKSVKGAPGGASKDADGANKGVTAGGSAVTATTAAATLASSSTRVECPPDGEELGRSAWAFLHSSAAYFPSDPTAQQQSSMLALLRALPHIYPCHSCAEALGEEYKREDKEGGWEDRSLKLADAVRSGPSLRKWLCGIHNEVNQRLGKPTFPCTEAKLSERWLEGPADGSCD